MFNEKDLNNKIVINFFQKIKSEKIRRWNEKHLLTKRISPPQKNSNWEIYMFENAKFYMKSFGISFSIICLETISLICSQRIIVKEGSNELPLFADQEVMPGMDLGTVARERTKTLKWSFKALRSASADGRCIETRIFSSVFELTSLLLWPESVVNVESSSIGIWSNILRELAFADEKLAKESERREG